MKTSEMIKFLLMLMADGAYDIPPELAYCEKEGICYLYNMLECVDPDCPGYHCCKFCWKVMTREFHHASNDATDETGCPRMTATYRDSLIKAGKGMPPHNYYRHQSTRAPAAATQPTTTPSVQGSSATPASFYNEKTIPLDHLESYNRHWSEREGASTNPNLGSTEGSESLPGTSVCPSASSTLRQKLDESERVRKHFATEIKRLEESLAATQLENRTLKNQVASLETDNLKLLEQLARSKKLQHNPSGRLAMPYQLTGPDRDMNKVRNPQLLSHLNQASTVHLAPGHRSDNSDPAGGDARRKFGQKPFDILTFAYSEDPDKTCELFGKRSGPSS